MPPETNLTAVTAATGLAASVWPTDVLCAIAWTSRGFRSPARETLLSSPTPNHAYGRAFGLERADENLGAVVGPLAAAGLVAWLGMRPALRFASIPGSLAAVAITIAACEARRRHVPGVRERIQSRNHTGFPRSDVLPSKVRLILAVRNRDDHWPVLPAIVRARLRPLFDPIGYRQPERRTTQVETPGR